MACLLKLQHKNIIALKEVIDDPRSEKVYLFMDFCQGGTLHDKLQMSEAGLPEAQVKVYYRSLISAIHYCHEVQNIAHRDIKPENIMLDERDQKVRLCDFGCSEFFQPTSDKLSIETKGTYLFMAPEMFMYGVEKRGRPSDIWAAGITLYNLLTKRFPF